MSGVHGGSVEHRLLDGLDECPDVVCNRGCAERHLRGALASAARVRRRVLRLPLPQL